MEYTTKYRSIFLSDIHLGVCSSASTLREWIRNNHSVNIYLLGDIIDIWALKNDWNWPEEYNQLVRTLLKCAEYRNVVYVPGNHDEAFKQFDGLKFGEVKIKDEYEHVGVDGKRYLLCHGHQFDSITMNNIKLAKIGSWLYDVLVSLNGTINKIRKLFGYKKYWSLAGFIKSKIKNAGYFVKRFEDTLVAHAKSKQYDGVICGHVHCPDIKQIDGTDYLNCGDIVDSMSFLVENLDGKFEIIRLERLIQ